MDRQMTINEYDLWFSDQAGVNLRRLLQQADPEMQATRETATREEKMARVQQASREA